LLQPSVLAEKMVAATPMATASGLPTVAPPPGLTVASEVPVAPLKLLPEVSKHLSKTARKFDNDVEKFMKAARSIEKSAKQVDGFIHREDGKCEDPSGFKPYKGPLDVPTLDQPSKGSRDGDQIIQISIPRNATRRRSLEIY
jgi:hypothetical protein